MSNFLKYKKIDAETDMIIATSGTQIINFNKIISSSSSPYSVDILSSKAFSPINYSRKLLALYIIDLNNAVSLI